MPYIFDGIGPGIGVAMGFGGLAAETDVEETIQSLPRHKQLRYQALGIEGIRGDPDVNIKSRVRINPGFVVRGIPSLPGLAGSLAIGGLLDGLIEILLDQNNLCLSPSERMWNGIGAASWGMVGGGIGSAVSFTMLSRAVKTGRYFAAPLATSARATVVGAITGLGVGAGIDWMRAD
jgi:hypothetical protein